MIHKHLVSSNFLSIRTVGNYRIVLAKMVWQSYQIVLVKLCDSPWIALLGIRGVAFEYGAALVLHALVG